MRTLSSSALLLANLLACAAATKAASIKTDYLVFTGTFTTKDSKGIYAFRYHSSNHELTPLGLAAAIASPSFIALGPDEHYLYSVSAVAEGTVSAFRIDFKSGKLTLLNTVSSHGGGPCHLLVDKTGKSLFVANFRTGSTAALRIRDDGSLQEPASFFQATGSSKDPAKQTGPHEHSVNIPRNNRFLLVTDLGLDKIFSYRIDTAKALLTANDPPFVTVQPGAGPRHLAFTPDERYVYVINEIQSSVSAFHYDAASGSLHEFQNVSALPEYYSGENTGAEIEVDSSGRFVYTSNRGYDSIAQFSIDSRTGSLTLVGQTPTGGKTPRYFALDPSGQYLFAANQDSDNIVLFHVDQKTGRLTPAGKSVQTPSPVCIKFVAVR
ncbi:MAG TPA: lactonase family protein [Bryobacteraceae bacterium]|nr:lactonase family protein [Bryobacteraceae bacterium]